MCQIHSYCKDTMFYICGDFNVRCSNFEDFIAGVDSISDRDVIDFSSNKYGEVLSQFLIDTNWCILKAEIRQKNSYTCIRPRGSSVVY